MSERLPNIDIAVRQRPQDAVLAFAEAARTVGNFGVEIVPSFTGVEGDDIANVRLLTPSVHRDLGIQFISLKETRGRVSVEVRASQWEPDFMPTYEAYCEAAKQLAGPILRAYNAANSSRCRLRIETRASMVPKLPQASEKSFNRFAALANRTGLHPLDWRRFYAFVLHSRSRPLSEDGMTMLLTSKGFPREYAAKIATVYGHLCEFKAMR